LNPITGPDLCRVLEQNGWQLRRVKGSHHIFSKQGERKIICGSCSCEEVRQAWIGDSYCQGR
jgi:predicted RNA binding protein YcfA (HicA-like mRNA interferase family)